MEKYVLFDRDGVINVQREQPVKSLDDFIFLPMVAEAFYEINRNDIYGVILDNDAALATGETDYESIHQINSRIDEYIGESGGRVHDVLVCPQMEDVKYPHPALIEKAAEKHGFPLGDTFFVTASLEGLQAGWAAKCKTAFVKTGKPYKTLQYLQTSKQLPDIIQPDLLSVVIKICRIYAEEVTPS